MLSRRLRMLRQKPVALGPVVALANQTADAGRSLTLTGIPANSMVVAMIANRTTTAPGLLSGYTDVLAINNARGRSLRVQYRLVTSSSETISWTGAYGCMVALTNAKYVRQSNSVNSATSAVTIPLPNLSGLTTNGFNFILAGAYVASSVGAVSSPYTLIPSLGGRVSNNTGASISSTCSSTTKSTATA